MKKLVCDVLIVGAGPAGASAAIAAAKRDARVVMVERRSVVGVPVRCAEYIPAPLLGELAPYVSDTSYVVQRLYGMRTILPNGKVKEMRAPGFTIHRDRFDQVLAKAAEQAGARILLETQAVGRENKTVRVKSSDGSLTQIEAAVIIGADGPHTTVGKWIGAPNRHLMPAVQAQVPLIEAMDVTEVYFDPEVFGGYVWIFPKGDHANVGLGIQRNREAPIALKQLLTRFIDRFHRDGKIEKSVLGYTAGWIPADRPRRVVHQNILLTGDAAGHTHPITGAGIFHAVVCGRMAGKWAARAVNAGDMKVLNGYETEWRDLLEDVLERAYSRRKTLEANWADRLDEIIPQCWVAYKEYYGRS
jgi:digeranylgeranylglycerophospholipid reductase